MSFSSEQESHNHSLFTLESLYEYDDFMESVGSIIDMGCGKQMLDLEWWATRTTRDENPIPLNIRCVGVDKHDTPSIVNQYPNLAYYKSDFNNPPEQKKSGFDVVYSHNSFQYSLNPLQTLTAWNHIANPGGMLILSVPQTTNLIHNQLSVYTEPCTYFHYTFANLMYMLSVTGWECADGHFYKSPTDPWLNLIVYKGTHGQLDPSTTTWYDISDRGLLPQCASDSIFRFGHVRQQDLVLPWIDKNLIDYSQQ